MMTIAQPSGITHLICDCDGVLLDSERIALRVLHAQLLPLLPAQHDADGLYQAIAVRLGMFTSQLLAELDHDFSLGLTRCGLLPLFAGHIHSADEVGHPKSAPHVYLAAAAGLGVDPRHCVAIDDSVTGVRAASAAVAG